MRARQRRERLKHLRELQRRNGRMFRMALVDYVAELMRQDKSGEVVRSLGHGVLEGIQDAYFAITREVAELTPGKVIPFPGKHRGGVMVQRDQDLDFFRAILSNREEKLKAAVAAGAGPAVIRRHEGMIAEAREEVRLLELEITHPGKVAMRQIAEGDRDG